MRNSRFSHTGPCGETHPVTQNITNLLCFVYLKNNYASGCWAFCTVVGVVAISSLHELALLPLPPAVQKKRQERTEQKYLEKPLHGKGEAYRPYGIRECKV